MGGISLRQWLRSAVAASALLAPVGALAQAAAQAPAGGAPPTNVGTVSANGAGGAKANNTATPSAQGTQAQAYALKKAVINEIQVQPQSVIQQLPDVNVAEALQRVPGISLETDTGEGRFINVRGLNADLNSVTFGGVRLQPTNLSSVQGGQRAVALDAVPAYAVGGLELIETLRPEDDAESLGGLINLVPREVPANGDPTLDATAGYGEEMLRGTTVSDYGIFAGGSFGLAPGRGFLDHPGPVSGWMSNPKPFSVYIFDTQHNDFRGIDDLEPAYSDQQAAGAPDKLLTQADLRYYHNNRRRWGRGGGFEFKPNEENHWYFHYVETGYTEHTGKDFLTLTGLDSGFNAATGVQQYDPANPQNFLAPAATASRTSTDGQETVTDRVLSWGGDNVVFNTVKIDYRGAYSEGLDNFPYSYGPSFSTAPFPLSYHFTGSIPNFSFQPLNGIDLTNPANYNMNESVSNGGTFNRDAEWSGAANVSVPWSIFGTDEDFKTGAILRLRNRVQDTNAFLYNNPPDGTSLSQYTGGSDIVYYDNLFNIGPPINEQKIRKLTNSLLIGPDVQTNLLGTASAQENVYAAYLQDSGSFGNWDWVGGVRMEQTFGVYNANEQINNPDGSITILPNTFKHAYVDYFPSLQLKYNAGPNLVFRGIYSTGLARPGFNQISPAVSIDPVNLIVSTGNPHLGATYGNNFDVGFEYYLPEGGIVSLYGFDKEFTNYILPFSTFGFYNNPLVAGQRVQIQTFEPSGHSRVYGIEGIYTQKFTFLPAPFNGLGVDTNFTYNESAIRFAQATASGGTLTQTTSLPETSPWNFNASLTYDAYNTVFRFTMSYVSRNIYNYGSTKALDTYLQGRLSGDLGVEYHVTPHATLYFDAKNLTNVPLEYTEGPSANRPIQREFYGTDIIGGLRVHF